MSPDNENILINPSVNFVGNLSDLQEDSIRNEERGLAGAIARQMRNLAFVGEPQNTSVNLKDGKYTVIRFGEKDNINYPTIFVAANHGETIIIAIDVNRDTTMGVFPFTKGDSQHVEIGRNSNSVVPGHDKFSTNPACGRALERDKISRRQLDVTRTDSGLSISSPDEDKVFWVGRASITG